MPSEEAIMAALGLERTRQGRNAILMIRDKNMLIGIVIGVILVGALVGVTGLPKKLGQTGFSVTPKRMAVSANESNAAPEFVPGDWINSGPLKLKDLRGRVVLVDFWTFGCYNCRNTLPFLKKWHEQYRDKGLTIVGVHSPEFESEKKIENVRREVASLGIRYPVVTDNDFANWRAYNVEAWPTVFLIDKQGRVRWTHVGEGAYEEAERVIQKLLAEDQKADDTQ
jgi:thiol-disulfide isomerase/thioredoxin